MAVPDFVKPWVDGWFDDGTPEISFPPPYMYEDYGEPEEVWDGIKKSKKWLKANGFVYCPVSGGWSKERA